MQQVEGVLVLCEVCGDSPHRLGCPRRPDYDDDTRQWYRTDSPEEVGNARFWVEGTFMAAALDAGVESSEALQEGMEEFERAVQGGWLKPFRK